MLVRSKKRPDIFAFLAFLLTISWLLNGCVSKSKADAQARMAFLAGQQQATMRMQQMQQPQQARGPSVTFTGPVQNFVVAWRVGLMLTQAIVGANYLGNGDPSAIVIHRSGQDIPIDPKQLLNGEDFPLQIGDVIELQQAGAASQ
jgi:hypothetical protein